MWQETKHGLYRQFNFENFKEAWAFMEKVAAIAERHQHHPRWENEWSVVQVWLITHEGGRKITDKDRKIAAEIDQAYGGQAAQFTSNEKPQIDEVKMFADGGSRGNPGPSSSGFVVMDMEDTVLIDKGVYLGVTTNNQAEYTALKLGLEECLSLGAKTVHVYMDSLLVVNQMKGIYKVKNHELRPIHDAIARLAGNFEKVSYNHVPREFNKLADAAVNRALDDQLGRD